MNQQNILIVDDHPENLVALEAILEAPDRNLIKAYSGNEALGLVLKMDFALVLLDVQMPEMDGFEVASLMHQNKNTRSIPIIFVTAINKDQKFVFKGYESGAIDYLFKPLNETILEHKVTFFLELDAKNKLLQQRYDELTKLKEDNELLLKSVGEAVIGIDRNGDITFLNPAAFTIFDKTPDELSTFNISSLLFYDDKLESPLIWQESATYTHCMNGNSDKRDQNIYGIREGQSFPIEFIATPIVRAGSCCGGAVFALRDITQRRDIEKKLLHSARYDALTGLANRNYFDQILNNAISRAKRNGTLVGLMFMDLDRFKQVNDSLGHPVGDLLLQEVATRLSACTRDGDTLCRLGGDEFTLILETPYEPDDIIIVANKILDELSKKFHLMENNNAHEVHVGGSIGIACYPQSADSATALIKCADIAMYQAKTLGRNNCQIYSSSMEADNKRTIELEGLLRKGIEKEEFYLLYQPQVDSRTGQVIGVEALVRWQPEGHAIISPTEFIPLAEESGFIVPLGHWILDKACTDVSDMCKSTNKPPCTLSVNLSMRQLVSNNITQSIESIIQSTGIPPALLNLEITESMVMDDPEEKISKLNFLKRSGLSISVDDFGTGYSSLSYIKRLPIDTLKIDRIFVNDIGVDIQGESIIKAIIGMAHSLNLKIIAEGVETGEQLSFLQKHGCFIIQGYFYSKPIPLDELLILQETGFPAANDDIGPLPSSDAANA